MTSEPTRPKCDFKNRQFCRPMSLRIAGKFSDGTFSLDEIIDPTTGKVAVHAVVMRNPPSDFAVRSLGLRLNFCPWCGEPLFEPEPKESEPNIVMERRSGTFRVSCCLIREYPDEVLRAFQDCLIVGTKFVSGDMIEYTAFSKHFDPVEKGESRAYDIIFTTNPDRSVTSRFVKAENPRSGFDPLLCCVHERLAA